jgi:pyruvate dehydrogenase E2 component (dihydrolipoamide acetyltransferase)
MSTEIVMPKLSDTMEEGKILRWLKHPGDRVRRGEALAEVETDKADMILEAFDEGVLEEIKLPEGESAAVGAVIALLAAPGEAVVRPEPAAAPKVEDKPAEAAPHAEEEEEVYPELAAHPSATPTGFPKPPPRPLKPKVEEVAVTPEEGEAHKYAASPLARRAAEEAGIDLAYVRGTGPGGRITKRDVDKFLRDQQLFRQRRIVAPREGAPGTREELSKMRKTIAQRMALSKREIPHFYVTVEVDMDEAVRFKKSIEATELFEQDITYNDIIIRACALALGRYPRINSSFDNDGINIFPDINIGMAVAVEDGLIVPVIRECQRLSLPEIARVAHRLVTKAAHGGFTSDELSGATFTISNMGMLGVEHFAAVINPPQAAILAVSAIKDRAVVRNGQIVVGKTMMVTIACDHRIIDGVVAGRFLQEMKRFLENPASLLV